MGAGGISPRGGSGDPLTDRVTIWTRVTSGPRPSTSVGSWPPTTNWPKLSPAARRSPAPRTITQSRSTSAASSRGASTSTASPLAPSVSQAGRARTLEGVALRHLLVRQVQRRLPPHTARIAERDDFLLHLGDYNYEASNRPPKGRPLSFPIPYHSEVQDAGGLSPSLRPVSLGRRAAPYAALPVIATIDDHELADGAWAGADAHDLQHGPWENRSVLGPRRPNRSQATQRREFSQQVSPGGARLAGIAVATS